jgi:hypothetical protein
MTDFIGYEPNRQRFGGPQESNKRRSKVPSELINVLPVWKSFLASDRIIFKKKMLSMLKQTQATYLLKNEQYEVQCPRDAEKAAVRRESRVMNSPAPIRRQNGPPSRYQERPVPWTAPTPSAPQVSWVTPAHFPHVRATRHSAPARAHGQA